MGSECAFTSIDRGAKLDSDIRIVGVAFVVASIMMGCIEERSSNVNVCEVGENCSGQCVEDQCVEVDEVDGTVSEIDPLDALGAPDCPLLGSPCETACNWATQCMTAGPSLDQCQVSKPNEVLMFCENECAQSSVFGEEVCEMAHCDAAIEFFNPFAERLGLPCGRNQNESPDYPLLGSPCEAVCDFLVSCTVSSDICSETVRSELTALCLNNCASDSSGAESVCGLSTCADALNADVDLTAAFEGVCTPGGQGGALGGDVPTGEGGAPSSGGVEGDGDVGGNVGLAGEVGDGGGGGVTNEAGSSGDAGENAGGDAGEIGVGGEGGVAGTGGLAGEAGSSEPPDCDGEGACQGPLPTLDCGPRESIVMCVLFVETQECLWQAQCPEPLCGDGLREDGESCDDGNNVDGDGCSGRCETEEAACVRGVHFDSDEDHVTLAHGDALSFMLDEDFSIDAWVFVDSESSGTERPIFFWGDDFSALANSFVKLEVSSDNHLRGWIRPFNNSGVPDSDVRSERPIALDRWQHVVFSRAFGSSLSLHVDGQRVGESADSQRRVGFHGWQRLPYIGNTMQGQYAGEGGRNHGFRGSLARIGFWRGVLSESVLRKLGDLSLLEFTEQNGRVAFLEFNEGMGASVSVGTITAQLHNVTWRGGECFTPAVQCSSDAECDDGQMCDVNTCVAAENETCEVDEDCAPAFVCRMGSCSNPVAECLFGDCSLSGWSVTVDGTEVLALPIGEITRSRTHYLGFNANASSYQNANVVIDNLQMRVDGQMVYETNFQPPLGNWYRATGALNCNDVFANGELRMQSDWNAITSDVEIPMGERVEVSFDASWSSAATSMALRFGEWQPSSQCSSCSFAPRCGSSWGTVSLNFGGNLVGAQIEAAQWASPLPSGLQTPNLSRRIVIVFQNGRL